MQDKVETYGKGSVFQHGKINDRVYLIKLDKNDFPGIIQYIDKLAKDNAYTKIFCKIPFWAVPKFVSAGFINEAYIPRFYKNGEDVFFMSKFLSSDRIMRLEDGMLEAQSQLLESTHENGIPSQVLDGVDIELLNSNKSEEIAFVYKQVFDSYPFPIYDPSYINETMDEKVQYYGIEQGGRLVALASAEIDWKGGNAEMTDFATLPEARGNNYSVILLKKMETEMKKQGIDTLYTIARLNSIAMNKTFLKLAYRYSGTLIKNTNIAGKIESMNVYYKHI